MSERSSDAPGGSGDAVGVEGNTVMGASASTAANGGVEGKPGEGKTGGLRSTLPVVTLDADAVQKFAEIELQWGER